jgi:hypothetical protein
LPWPAPDPRRFSSIHSNPPWVATDHPEIVLSSFGQGCSVYCATAIEQVPTLEETFVRLIRLLGGEFTFEAETHPSVELSLFRQDDRQRYVLSLIAFQQDLPNLPVPEVRVTLRLPREVHRIDRLPDGTPLPFEASGRAVAFTLPRLETLALLAIRTD